MNPDAHDIESWTRAHKIVDLNFPTLLTDTPNDAQVRVRVLHKTEHALTVEAQEPGEFGAVIKVHLSNGYAIIDGEFSNLFLPINPTRIHVEAVKVSSTLGWFRPSLNYMLELPHLRMGTVIGRLSSPVGVFDLEAALTRVGTLLREELDERLAIRDMSAEAADSAVLEFGLLCDELCNENADLSHWHKVHEFLGEVAMSELLNDEEPRIYLTPDPTILADLLAGLHTVKHVLASGALADLV